MVASNGDIKKEGEQNIQGWLLKTDRSLWSPKEIMNYFYNDAINLISCHCFLYIPHESVRNFMVFWCFQWYRKIPMAWDVLSGNQRHLFSWSFSHFRTHSEYNELTEWRILRTIAKKNLSNSQTSNIHDQRQGLIKLVKDIFDKEQDALIAEINTLSEYRNERLPVNEDILQKEVRGIHLEYIF